MVKKKKKMGCKVLNIENNFKLKHLKIILNSICVGYFLRFL